MQQNEQKSEKFKCHECGMTFNSERERREHEQNAHRGGSGQGTSTTLTILPCETLE
jgi:protein-arginine kinase activator protein McsA